MTYSRYLNRDQVLRFQEALLTEYSKPDFQKKLQIVLSDEFDEDEKTDLEFELRELRQGLGAKFGFENSHSGVQESVQMFTTEFCTDLEIMRNCNYLNLLVYPNIRDELDAKMENGKCTREEQHLAKSIKRRLELALKYDLREKAEKARKALEMKKLNKKCFIAEAGRYWRVTGGEKSGGIVVRADEELQSAELLERLATGSLVEEMELNGERLHYKLVTGQGPDLGWVSITVKGATLLQPATTDGVQQLEEARLADKMPELEDEKTLVQEISSKTITHPTVNKMTKVTMESTTKTTVAIMTKTPVVEREDVLKLQEALIFEYSKPEFQAKLQTMYVGTCPIEDFQKLKEEIRELREKVGAKFGFEASPEGVEKSIKLIKSKFPHDYKIGMNSRKINDLILGKSKK